MDSQTFTVSVIVGIILIIIIVLIFSKEETLEWKVIVKKQLSVLNKRLKTNDFVTLKSCLIDADKLLDHTLIKKHIKGETLGERLKNSKNLFESKLYNEVWDAHKVRNQLVHEIEFQIKDSELKSHYYKIAKSISSLM